MSSISADIYKIVPASLWYEATTSGVFCGSADDVRDGFIHLSNAQQLRGTAEKYFKHQTNLLLIGFSGAALAPQLKWEASRGGALFPHYYGPLPVRLALWQKPMLLDAGGVPYVLED